MTPGVPVATSPFTKKPILAHLSNLDLAAGEEPMNRKTGVRIVCYQLTHFHVRVTAGMVEQCGYAPVPEFSSSKQRAETMRFSVMSGKMALRLVLHFPPKVRISNFLIRYKSLSISVLVFPSTDPRKPVQVTPTLSTFHRMVQIVAIRFRSFECFTVSSAASVCAARLFRSGLAL